MDNISFIDAFLNGQLVGKLAMTPQSLCAFEYDTDYLKEGISISPFFIPLKPGLLLPNVIRLMVALVFLTIAYPTDGETSYWTDFFN